MRNITLLTGTMLFLPMTATAQSINCTPSPDCASLGYTETSCPDGAGVKCPWGNTWFCTQTCDELGFSYICSGTGYAGGSGEACGGKYKSCTCASGYEWNQENGTCEEPKPEWGKCNGSAKTCNIGDILYSDGTCSPQNISGKTPIAVVVYKSSDGNCAQAMALNSIGSYIWSSEYVDIPNLTNFGSNSTASQDLASCENTGIITATGTSSTYPAAWAAKNYNTAGTEPGDWCLPAGGIMMSIKNNMSTINNGFNLIGGAQIGTYSSYWSSSEVNSNYTWYSGFIDGYGLRGSNGSNKDFSHDVRPVLEF